MNNFKKKDFYNMSIIKITTDEVELSSTLETDDIGYWCLLVNGSYQGFCDTKEEVQELYELMSN